MPRIKQFTSKEQAAIESDLRKRLGGMASRHAISIELGVHDMTAEEFLLGLPVVMVGKRKKYRVSDVARRIYERTVTL